MSFPLPTEASLLRERNDTDIIIFDSFIEDPLLFDVDLFKLFLTGSSVKSAQESFLQRKRDERRSNKDLPEIDKSTAYLYVLNQYREFDDVVAKLESPLSLDSYIQLPTCTKRQLVYLFYALDPQLLLEIAGKRINLHLRRDVESMNGISSTRMRVIQITNLRRISKFLESSQFSRTDFIDVSSTPPIDEEFHFEHLLPIAKDQKETSSRNSKHKTHTSQSHISNVAKTNLHRNIKLLQKQYAFPLELANHYVCICFMAKHKMTIEKKLGITDFALVENIVGVLLDLWTEKKSFQISVNFKALKECGLSPEGRTAITNLVYEKLDENKEQFILSSTNNTRDVIAKSFMCVWKLGLELADEKFDEFFNYLDKIHKKLRLTKDGCVAFFKTLENGFSESFLLRVRPGVLQVWKNTVVCMAKCFLIYSNSR